MAYFAISKGYNGKFTGPSTKRQMFGENLFTGDGMMNWVIYVNSSFTLAAFLEKSSITRSWNVELAKC